MKPINPYIEALLHRYYIMPTVITKLEKYIKKKCYGSKEDPRPVDKQFEPIAEAVTKRYDLVVLYEITKELLGKVSEEDYEILKYYYCLEGVWDKLPDHISFPTRARFKRCVDDIVEKMVPILDEIEVDKTWLVKFINESPFLLQAIPYHEQIHYFN